MGAPVAARNRAIRQEALREQLSEQCRVQHVIENIKKLEDLSNDLDSTSVARIKTANEQRIKLLNKYLPDLKSMELTGEGGDDLKVKHSIFEFVPVGNAETQD